MPYISRTAFEALNRAAGRMNACPDNVKGPDYCMRTQYKKPCFCLKNRQKSGFSATSLSGSLCAGKTTRIAFHNVKRKPIAGPQPENT